MMVAFFLVLLSGSGAPSVVPKPFTTLEACEDMGKDWKATSMTRAYECLTHVDGHEFESK